MQDLPLPVTAEHVMPPDAMQATLEASFINRFNETTKDMPEEAREFLLLMYRNGVADGNRIALTVLSQPENYHPTYNELPELGKTMILRPWHDAATLLSEFGNKFLEKIKQLYNISDEDLNEPTE